MTNTEKSIIDHSIISRADRYRFALFLYGYGGDDIAQIRPTAACFLNNYLKRALVVVTWTDAQWLANGSRFATTDNMTGWGSLSGQLPLLNITEPALALLDKARAHPVALLVESAP